MARIFTRPDGYPKDVIGALGLLKNLLEVSTARAFHHPLEPAPADLSSTPSAPSIKAITTSIEPLSQLETLQKSCLDASLALYGSYAYSAFELRIGRVPVKDIKPLLTTVNRMREELAWGDRSKTYSPSVTPVLQKRQQAERVGAPRSSSRDRTSLDELDEPCRACSAALGNGISVLQAVVGKCYGIKFSAGPPGNNKTASTSTNKAGFEEPLSCRARIIAARAELKAKLDSAVHRTNQARRTDPDDTEGAQLPTQLFEKSLHATSLLHMSSELIRALTLIHAILEIHRTSRPRLFFLRPSWLWLGMSPRALVAEEDGPSPPAPEAPGPDADVLSVEEANAVLPGATTPKSRRVQFSLKRIWGAPFMLRARIRLSRMIWSVKHSKHVHHAIKNALGVGLLVIPAVLPASSAGELEECKKYFDSNYGVWAIISFTYVLEPNTALTWRVGIWRLFGTTIGALYAYIVSLGPPENPYGIVVLVTAAEILLTWLVRSSTPGVGVVAPGGAARAANLHRNSRGVDNQPRLIPAALSVTSADSVALDGNSRTLNERVQTKTGIAHSAKLELRIRELIARENVWLAQMEHEISLMPKPIRLYRASAESVQRIADLVSGLRRIRENVPHEAIDQVLQHRQHTMLPSPRKAMDALSRELMEVLQDVPRATDIGYAVAEQEVREEMIEALEVLIEVTRALFGTSAWLEGGAEGTGSFGRSGVASPVSGGRAGPW
ncbi:hypothetical protein FRC10_010421 [Ceratobasidium sp. 414]|nr:hypothetical protein FRC10_010421 [Ceratobasidium sp. 414]